MPISLFACITETSAVSFGDGLAHALGRHDARLIDRHSVVCQPRRASALSVFSTASCSMALATRWRRPVGLERLGGAADGEVVGFGAAAGEDDFRRIAVDERRHRRPGLVEGGLRLLAEVMDTRRIAEKIA